MKPEQSRDRRAGARRWSRQRRGQSLVEFALILPILLMLVGGIIQYGVIFSTKHSLIQVGRDVGRWAATQSTDAAGNPLPTCRALATDSPPQPLAQANLIAQQSQLMAYADGVWNTTNFTAYPLGTPMPAPDPTLTEGVEVAWTIDSGVCPPASPATDVAWVTVRLTHRAPVLLPGFPYLPGLGTCDSSGCYFVIRTTAEFRIEPAATP